MRIAAKKGRIVAVDKTSATVSVQDLKRKSAEVVDLQPGPKGQQDVYSQSGANNGRFTELILQEHEVAVRVPSYIVSGVEQLEEKEQDFEWILGLVQKSYIEEQSNVRMYDVLFADGNRKCIPSGFTEQILRHEEDAIQETNIVEPTCNSSSDNDSEDEDGVRDGEDSWPDTYEDDLAEQATEWEALAHSLGFDVGSASVLAVPAAGSALSDPQSSMPTDDSAAPNALTT